MLDKIALILTIIGGLNWGLIGIFQFDLVAWVCGGQSSIISRVIYTVVALGAIWCMPLRSVEQSLVIDACTNGYGNKCCHLWHRQRQPQTLFVNEFRKQQECWKQDLKCFQMTQHKLMLALVAVAHHLICLGERRRMIEIWLPLDENGNNWS